jgi:uncharacterized protein (DUF1697 family)
MGFSDVMTYIQSGNVVFGAKTGTPDRIAAKIEEALSARFRYSARVVVVSHADLRTVVRKAPKGFGSAPGRFRYNAIFLKKPFTPKKALRYVTVRKGVDTVHAGKGMLYFSNTLEGATRSRLSKITQTPLYAYLTIRNWNTTTKLLALMDGDKK